MWDRCGDVSATRSAGVIQFALGSFTLTLHINALYNESKHGKEEHAT